ncbi:MAG: chorismate mutase [Ignavibacteriales bacterium]|nr:chorismate mutase [Ignavibacteriales bacterium]
MSSINIWRKKIDELDAELVKLLNERAKFAEEIGKLKSQLGLDAYSPEREEEIMENVAKKNSGPLSLQAIRRLYERIIDESRSVERSAMNKNRNTPPSKS